MKKSFCIDLLNWAITTSKGRLCLPISFAERVAEQRENLSVIETQQVDATTLNQQFHLKFEMFIKTKKLSIKKSLKCNLHWHLGGCKYSPLFSWGFFYCACVWYQKFASLQYGISKGNERVLQVLIYALNRSPEAGHVTTVSSNSI